MELAPRPEYGLVRPLFRLRGRRRPHVRRPEPRRRARRRAASRSRTRRCAPPSRSPRATSVGFSLRWAPAESARRPSRRPAGDVAARIADTAEAWRSWEAEHDVYEGPHRELVRLQLARAEGPHLPPDRRDRRRAHDLAPGDASAASATGTTATPWIRDASLTLEALYIGACSDEAEDFVSFMTSSAGGRASERLAADHVRDRRRARPLRARAAAPARLARLRARCASATAPGTRPSSTSTASC